MMQKGTAPGPEKNTRPQQKQRRRFLTYGSYFAFGILVSAATLAWTGRVALAIWYYAAGALAFILFCQPVVDIVLKKLEAVMEQHHQTMPFVHGAWLAAYCPSCGALHAK